MIWIKSPAQPQQDPPPLLENFSLESYPNKIIFLNFWATWCVPCLYEIPTLTELQRKYPDDLQIIGISLDEDLNAIQHFLKKANLNYPILLYNPQEFKEYGPIAAVPTTLIFNKSQQLIHKIPGYKEKGFFEQILKDNL